MHYRTGAARRLLSLSAIVPAAFWLAMSPAPAAAADDATRLDGLQVTASRVERPLDEALASVTVLDRASIEQSQAPDLIDLLGRQAGIDIARTGGPGSGSALFLRGGNSNHVLVLVDGIRVASAGQGVFDFAHLPLDQIERIEIVRGPRASVWGSDAIGGVVQVFTRDPGAASARVSAGSDGLFGASVGTGRAADGRGFGVTVGYERLDGFSATTPANAFSYDPDDDGYRNRNLGLRGHVTLGDQRLGFTAIGTSGTVEFDRGITDARNASGGFSVGGPLADGWEHQLTLGHAREDLESRGSFPNAFRSRRDSADWLHRVATGDAADLRFGGNWQRERGRSSNAFDGLVFARTRDSAALFAGWGGRIGAHLVDASLRRDHSDQYGGATTANIAWGRDIGDSLHWRLGWGEAFRAPNFNELYYPDFGFGFAGDPSLRPERSSTWETGLDWRPAPGHAAGLSVYRTRVDDLIAFAAPGTNNAINIDRAALDGVEVEYRHRRGGWTAGGNATWQRATNLATGRPLLRRAPRKAHLDVGYRFEGGLMLAVDADAVSAREDYAARLPGFGLLHLRASIDLAPDWRLEARIENLAGREYTLVDGYGTPGRSAIVSLVWRGAD